MQPQALVAGQLQVPQIWICPHLLQERHCLSDCPDETDWKSAARSPSQSHSAISSSLKHSPYSTTKKWTNAVTTSGKSRHRCLDLCRTDL